MSQNPPSLETVLKLQYKQGLAFLSKATELLYGGAAGGGKSHLMRVAAIWWCMSIPGLQVYIFRREFPDLYKNHMEGPTSFPSLLAQWILRKWCSINHQKGVIRFWNGSCIHLCHCQYEHDVFGYQGAEIHVLLIDEITHWTESMYTYLRGRVRMTGLTLPPEYVGLFPRILVGGNPGGIGHNWVKATWIDTVGPFELKQMPEEDGGMLRSFIPAKLEDNPALRISDPHYKSRLKGLGNPALVKAMLEGDWDIVAGGMFDDVWDRSIHVIEPFAIPPSWYIDRSFDWGSSKPFSVGWWAESDGTEAVLPNGRRWCVPPGTLFRIHEWYGWNGKANQGLKLSDKTIAVGINERQVDWGIHGRTNPGPADSSIFDEINGDSPAKQQAAAQVYWTEADKRPGSRVRRWSLMRARFQASLKPRMEEPGIFIFNNCKDGFIRTVPVLPRDQKKTDDVDTASEDHCGDESGYRILATEREAMSVKMGFATN